tara:strand:+ start:19 stop:273 length:255 start_codon:yes stop_codon:yes gene_type:complete
VGSIPTRFRKNMSKFTIFFRLLWFGLIFSFMFFFDRENKIMIIIQLSSLFILTLITILRAIESRNEWRKIIDDGDVEIKDKISF